MSARPSFTAADAPTSDLGYKLAYDVVNAPVRLTPFPHIEIHPWLPWGLYNDLLASWPSVDKMHPINQVRPTGGYGETRMAYPESGDRTPQDGPWKELYDATRSGPFLRAWGALFSEALAKRHRDGEIQQNQPVTPDSLLVEDKEGYAIGPHTDSAPKIVSLLAYFPEVTNPLKLGTSLYIAKDGFTCPGGPHHDRAQERWAEVHRAPYRPNQMICFCKTDHSFHGVEPVPEGQRRRVYIWNLRQDSVANLPEMGRSLMK